MFKRKKLFIVAVVIVLMLAMTVTAYAATYFCYLRVDNRGEAKTAAVTSLKAKSTGYNSNYSTNSMELRLQTKVNGEWTKLARWVLPVNYWNFDSGLVQVQTPLSFRTKIYSCGYTGGVEGGGAIYDY